MILWGLAVAIPALAVTGASGFQLGRKYRGKRIEAKKKRTFAAAANGVLVLVPSAVFLAAKANDGSFDATFYAVQVLELMAGAANLTLLGLNIRDGFALSRRFSRAAGPNRALPPA